LALIIVSAKASLSAFRSIVLELYAFCVNSGRWSVPLGIPTLERGNDQRHKMAGTMIKASSTVYLRWYIFDGISSTVYIRPIMQSKHIMGQADITHRWYMALKLLLSLLPEYGAVATWLAEYGNPKLIQ
jgi:hypothetical protein